MSPEHCRGALSRHGVSMRTLLPGYPAVMKEAAAGRLVAEFDDLFDGPARLIAGRFAGLDLIVIDAPHLYARPGGPYAGPDGRDFEDNWRRFAALSWVAGQLAQGLIGGYQPQVLHAHDWQAGLVPAYVKYGPTDGVKTVMTVHNLVFQGHFGWDVFHRLDLPAHAFYESLEYYGGVGYLKAGLATSDAITTVSPTYAREIRTPAFGAGLDGLLNTRAGVLHGITNGIDVDAWDPATDVTLPQTYAPNTVHKRLINKAALRTRFGIEETAGPMFAVVSRLTGQKGIDLIASNVDWLVSLGATLVILGSGEPWLEGGLAYAAARHPGRVGMIRAYDESLSHVIQGGADAILRRRHPDPVAFRTLRPDAALWPALWLRADRQPGRRPRRYRDRRQRGGDRCRGGDRAAILAGDGRRRWARRSHQVVDLYKQEKTLAADAAARHALQCVMGPERQPLCRSLRIAFGAGPR